MTGETVDCYNCGHPNPAWAQVCRSCGVPLRQGGTPAPRGPIPTDQDSLISIGTAVGAILLAVVLGLIVSGMIPAAPVATPTSPSPSATLTPEPTDTPEPSVTEPSLAPSVEPTPALPGTVSFGFNLNKSTREVLDQTDTFGPNTTFCHSVSLDEPFGVSQILEEVARVADDGSETAVQDKTGLGVSSGSTIAGYCADADLLINGWGAGNYVLRDFRGDEQITEGTFSLTK